MRTVLIAAFLGLVTVTAVAEAQWLNYPDSRVLRSGDGKPVLTALAPRAADGKPDRSAASATAQTTAPAELRAILEGTWELEEWHAEGEIMRPPQMTGRWMVHDGVVMAIRHRDGPKSFESTAAYGEYRITSTEWIYGYARSEDATGPSANDAKMRVRVTVPVPMLPWKIKRDGTKVILEREKSIRWEFDGPVFNLFGADGQLIRKYRKLSP
jgi:hypothetical protein